MKKIILILFILVIGTGVGFAQRNREISDESYKFSLVLPSGWTMKDKKETEEKDGISYSFDRDDKKCAIMLLAFRLTAVKNLDDFIYTMEKDASLNIPTKTTDYSSSDAGAFDWKSAIYQDSQYTENIYFFRTKLPDAPNNFVYMLRFITTTDFISDDLDKQIKKIADSFLPTVK